MASYTKSEQQSPTHQTPTKTSPSSSSTTVSIANHSPRNTSSGALPSGTYVSFGPVEVSKALQDGEKFVKWDDVSLHINLFLNLNSWKINEIWFKVIQKCPRK